MAAELAIFSKIKNFYYSTTKRDILKIIFDFVFLIAFKIHELKERNIAYGINSFLDLLQLEYWILVRIVSQKGFHFTSIHTAHRYQWTEAKRVQFADFSVLLIQ